VRVGSLFTGIGGFDKAAEECGCTIIWQSEVEPFCIAVLKTRFPKAQRAGDIRDCRGLTSSVPVFRARTFPSPANGQGSKGNALDCFMSLRGSLESFDPLGFSSKMFPDFSVQTVEETLQKSSVFSWSSAGMGFAGVCSTANFSESPNAAAVSSLSDVLESHVPQRFFLSSRAAAGVLRRATKRGRILPTRLQKALEELAARDATMGRICPSPLTPNLVETSDHQSATKPTAPDSHEQQSSYWDETQITDTLDSSMLAKGQMMPEKRRFPCVLTPEGSVRATTQHSRSPKTCGTDLRAQPTMSVRRLTPTECEILQGFPKAWTVPDTEHWGTPSRSPRCAGSSKG